VIGFILFLVLPQAQPFRDQASDYIEDPKSLWNDLNPKYFKVADSATFKIERTMTIEATGGDVDFNIRVPAPKDYAVEGGKNIQTLKSYTPDAGDHAVLETSGGWLYFNGSVPEGQTARLTITYNMATETYIWDDIKSSNSGTLEDIPESDKIQFNHDEYLVQGDDHRPLMKLDDVEDVAKEVVGSTTNVYDMVRALYDYILDEIVYQVGKEPKTCSQTLNGGVGDCDDMVLLFSAMCRSVGIPAYPGYGFISNQKFDGWGGHSWANVIIPDEDGNVYHCHLDLPNKKFLWYDPYRLIEWNSDGNEEHLTNYYFLYHGEGAGSGNFNQEWERIVYHTEGEKLIKAD